MHIGQVLWSCLGCAWNEEGSAIAHGQAAYVGRVEPIDVLFKADGISHLVSINVRWQWQLHQNAVYIWIGIELRNHLHGRHVFI